MCNSYHKKINIQCYGCGCCGHCCCACPGGPNSQTFSFYKLDQNSGAGLAGAVFQLERKDMIRNAISDSNGKTIFNNIELGEYTLHEIKAPKDYVKDSGTYSVIIHQNGVTINNMPADKFIISDCRIGNSTYLIYKENIDGYHGESLTLDVESGSIQTLLPNVFEMAEHEFVGWNTDPYLRGRNYDPGDDILIGCMLILYATWKSLPPSAVNVSKEAGSIQGKGISGSRIDLLLPTGAVESTIVKSNGDWSISLAASSPLMTSSRIRIIQTEFNMYKSDPIIVTVAS